MTRIATQNAAQSSGAATQTPTPVAAPPKAKQPMPNCKAFSAGGALLGLTAAVAYAYSHAHQAGDPPVPATPALAHPPSEAPRFTMPRPRSEMPLSSGFLSLSELDNSGLRDEGSSYVWRQLSACSCPKAPLRQRLRLTNEVAAYAQQLPRGQQVVMTDLGAGKLFQTMLVLSRFWTSAHPRVVVNIVDRDLPDHVCGTYTADRHTRSVVPDHPEFDNVLGHFLEQARGLARSRQRDEALRLTVNAYRTPQAYRRAVLAGQAPQTNILLTVDPDPPQDKIKHTKAKYAKVERLYIIPRADGVVLKVTGEGEDRARAEELRDDQRIKDIVAAYNRNTNKRDARRKLMAQLKSAFREDQLGFRSTSLLNAYETLLADPQVMVPGGRGWTLTATTIVRETNT